MKKLQVYHFYNGMGGGILAVIKNLLQFSSPEIDNHVIHTINKVVLPGYVMEEIAGAKSQQLFKYSTANNFYYTCSRLKKMIPGEDVVLVAHDWLELGMASNLGMRNPLVQIVHGNYTYYHELASKHSDVVDAFICISPKIYKSLLAKMQSHAERIFYLNFPVPAVNGERTDSEKLRLIYYVRDLKDSNKQFSTIIKIAELLKQTPTEFVFTIAAAGMDVSEFETVWPDEMKESVKFLGLKSNQEILKLLPEQDIFLLPSIAEGLPVSLVESMKAGVVPLVSNWDGAVEELVTTNITGYYFEVGDAKGYAACIRELQTNRGKLAQLSMNCRTKANTLFDPVINAKKFEKVYKDIACKTRVAKKRKKVYGSRLDHPVIPNFITRSLRSR